VKEPTELRGPDRFAAAKAVANSVLYEGYVLYPYRASAKKNQFRWQFGLLYPRGLGERSSARAECLLEPGNAGSLVVYVQARWLRAVRRDLEEAGLSGWRDVEQAKVGGEILVAWDEAKEVAVDLPPLSLAGAGSARCEVPLCLAEERQSEERLPAAGEPRVRLVRLPPALAARVAAGVEQVGSLYCKVSAELSNESPSAGLEGAHHNELARHCLIGAHVIFSVEGGSFVSSMGPPGEASDAAATCHSDGLYPVLVGDGTTVLAAPIILYDFPVLSPETPGDFYDATEIDEILGLRVLTLTDEEKSEARATDPLAAAVVERCDGMGPGEWARLHGIMRPLQELARSGAVGLRGTGEAWWSPEADAALNPGTGSVRIGGVEVRRGSKVRLVPGGGADAQDMFLVGRVGTVEGVFTDVDGGHHLAVSIEDDPAAAELSWQGRHFYFRPEEVEPLGTSP
jgi:hypothetical protein